ncbi:hypothetical protein V6N13_046958 [Hibiscus sabdariffa]
MVSGCLSLYEPTRHGPGATVALAGRSDEDLDRACVLNGSIMRPGDPMGQLKPNQMMDFDVAEVEEVRIE